MYLLIDDVRNFYCDAIARNSKSAMELLKLKCWTELGMDNDLGEATEGWQILRWAFDNDLVPPSVQLVTSNVVAAKKMAEDLEAHGYVGNANRTIWKKPNANTDSGSSQEASTGTQPS